MFKIKLLSIAAILLMFVGVGCGSSGPMGSDDQTALTGVVMVETSYDRVANATVNLAGGEFTTQTNENGVFTFVGVPVGSHEVMIESNQGSANTTVDVRAGGSRVEVFVN